MFRHKGGVGLSRDDAPFPSSVCFVYEPTVKGKSRTVLGISKKKLPVSEKKIFFVGAHVLFSFFFWMTRRFLFGFFHFFSLALAMIR